MKFYKQPLLHFLLIGFSLFLVFEYSGSWRDTSGKTIVVDRAALLTHLQYRSKAFDNERFDTMLDQMPEPERVALINEYVREEALYREALALGMDGNDYIIKRRMIQKIEYLARGFEVKALDDAGYRAYYEEHRDDYAIEATLTFTHVFVSADRHADAEGLAGTLLEQLVKDSTAFSDATQFGDSFVYNRNYVDRTEPLVASHFGTTFAAALFELEADFWQGPVRSAYGYHLVLLTDRKPAGFAEFEAVAGQVAFDAERVHSLNRTEQAIDRIIDSYQIDVLLE